MEKREGNRCIVVVREGDMTSEDMQQMKDNGMIVVQAKNPETVRFLVPPPAK